MGIIQKQALWTTIVVVGGMLAGIISRLLMPFVLTKEQIGVLALLDSVSNLFATIFCLGFIQIVIRIFPRFRNNENGHNGLLFLGILISLTGYLLAIATFVLSSPFMLGSSSDSGLLAKYSFLIFILIFWRILFKNMDAYMRMLFSTVVGATMESFLLKVIVLSSVLLYWGDYFGFKGLVYLYAFAFSVPGIVLLIVSFKSTKRISLPNKALFTKENKTNMIRYGLFGVLASASGILVLTIDQVMMARMLSVEDVGVYSVLFFAGVLVNVPGRGVKRIAMPVLAEYWKDSDIQGIQSVYQKSSITNQVSGSYLLLMGWTALPTVLEFLPDYQYGLFVFLFIGIGQLIDMMTGVNMEIIASSKKYSFNTYFNLILAFLVVVLNLYLIPRNGIVGSAQASCFAMLVVNAARWYYLKRTFGLQCFGRKALYAALITIVLFVIISITHLKYNSILVMVCMAIVLTLFYWGTILKLKLSEDVNNFYTKIIRKVLP